MPFSDELKTYSETRKRTSAQYIKVTPAYRVTIRAIDGHARTVWKHWIPQANGGKGLAAVCPNVSSQVRPCPIEKLIEADPDKADMKARRRFVVNVLDRTPVTYCESCGNTTPGKKCQFCGAKLDKNEFTPLNQIKILEGGPNLFNKTFNAIEKMQKDDFGVDITEYDIVLTAQGEGRDKQIIGTPSDPAPLPEEATLDAEGNPQELWNLDALTEPSTVEEIEAMLRGATMQELNEIRGVV